MTQDPHTTRAVREGMGGPGSRNSMARVGRPMVEDLWREQEQHTIIPFCYSIAEGIFPTPSRKDSERNFI